MKRRELLRCALGAAALPPVAGLTAPGELRLLRTRLWRRLDAVGLERASLRREPDGWSLRGTILLDHDGEAAEARYRVHCDEGWRTTRADIACERGAETRSLSLSVEGGRWLEGDREHAGVRGSIDVDLGWSPSTNTLPIRRLDLAVGERSGAVTAAWVRFPELALEPLPQEYERLAARRYRYTSRGGAFSADLEVDDAGLVIGYGGVWAPVPDPR